MERRGALLEWLIGFFVLYDALPGGVERKMRSGKTESLEARTSLKNMQSRRGRGDPLTSEPYLQISKEYRDRPKAKYETLREKLSLE